MTEEAVVTEEVVDPPVVTEEVTEEVVTEKVVEKAAEENPLTAKPDSTADGEGEVQGAPEQYEDFSFPEGVEADTTRLDEFKGIAKEMNLTQEQAQKLIDLDIQSKTAQAENWANTTKEWIDTAKSDKEYGGLQFDESVGLARKAIETFGSDGLKEILDSTGAGNHPEVIRFFYKVGKTIKEDSVAVGGNPRGEVDPAKILFPNMN